VARLYVASAYRGAPNLVARQSAELVLAAYVRKIVNLCKCSSAGLRSWRRICRRRFCTGQRGHHRNPAEQKVLQQPLMTATEVELVGLAKEAGLSQRRLTGSEREKIAAFLMQMKKR
jgi:hypothetical protein